MNQKQRLERFDRNLSYQEKDEQIGRLSEVFAYARPAVYVFSQIRNGKITEPEAYDTYHFIADMFKIKGFGESEAQTYLNGDYVKQLLGVRRKDLITTLSVLAIIGLDDIALFEEPNILCKNYNQTALYQAVRKIDQEGLEKSLDNVRRILLESGIKKDDKYLPRIQFLVHAYERNFNAKKEESEGAKKTLK